MYIGIPNDGQFIIDLLIKETGLKKENIYLTLIKIKLNDSFERLSDCFWVSLSNASLIFR